MDVTDSGEYAPGISRNVRGIVNAIRQRFVAHGQGFVDRFDSNLQRARCAEETHPGSVSAYLEESLDLLSDLDGT